MDFLHRLLSAIVWNDSFEANPEGGDDPSYGDDEIRYLKEAVRERFEKEHKMDTSVGTAGLDGWHRPGACITYFQAGEPTTRPDGVTALSANDNGRRWVRSTDYREHVYVHGTGWVNVTAINGAANLMSGDNTFSGDNVVTGTFDFQNLLDVDGATISGDGMFSGSNTFSAGGNIFNYQLAIFVDKKPAGTDGGTFNSGAWRTRTLNTERRNTIVGASLSGDEITLPAGTYLIRASAPAYRVFFHKIRLYNVTDGTVLSLGTSEYTHENGFSTPHSFITDTITIASSKTIRLEHRCSGSVSSNGFGNAAVGGLGTDEIYSMIEITRIA